MRFIKMHGCGNDYVYLDCFHSPAPENPSELSVKVSKPHTGIGSDGLILIEPCKGADARMRIFNKDGSEGEMCGNGIRCVGKYLYDSGIAQKKTISVDTRGGVKILEMLIKDGKAAGARVDMGKMIFDPARIPVAVDSNRIKLSCLSHTMEFFCLNAGNPHAVTADYFPSDGEFEKMGSALEFDPAFPERANVSFIKVLSPQKIKARVWERGSGPTMACGSGATACLVAAFGMGLCDDRATVCLPGGELFIEYDSQSGHAFMTGPAETVFVGDYLL